MTNTLARIAIELELLREVVRLQLHPVTFDPSITLEAALERSGDAGLTVSEVGGLKAGHAPLFLLALGDLVRAGAVEESSPGRFRFTAEHLEGRREARERAARNEAAESQRRDRQRFETAQQDAIDQERQWIDLQGPEWALAAKAFGWHPNRDGIERAQDLYVFLPNRSGDKHAFRCLYCGSEGELSTLPSSLTHVSLCLTATRSPAYATAKV
jgi:hypothetical protein